MRGLELSIEGPGFQGFRKFDLGYLRVSTIGFFVLFFSHSHQLKQGLLRGLDLQASRRAQSGRVRHGGSVMRDDSCEANVMRNAFKLPTPAAASGALAMNVRSEPCSAPRCISDGPPCEQLKGGRPAIT